MPFKFFITYLLLIVGESINRHKASALPNSSTHYWVMILDIAIIFIIISF